MRAVVGEGPGDRGTALCVPPFAGGKPLPLALATRRQTEVFSFPGVIGARCNTSKALSSPSQTTPRRHLPSPQVPAFHGAARRWRCLRPHLPVPAPEPAPPEPGERAGELPWQDKVFRACAILQHGCCRSIPYGQIQQKRTLVLSSRFSDGSRATKGKVSSLRDTSGGCAVLSGLLFGPKHPFSSSYVIHTTRFCVHTA